MIEQEATLPADEAKEEGGLRVSVPRGRNSLGRCVCKYFHCNIVCVRVSTEGVAEGVNGNHISADPLRHKVELQKLAAYFFVLNIK